MLGHQPIRDYCNVTGRGCKAVCSLLLTQYHELRPLVTRDPLLSIIRSLRPMTILGHQPMGAHGDVAAKAASCMYPNPNLLGVTHGGPRVSLSPAFNHSGFTPGHDYTFVSPFNWN